MNIQKKMKQIPRKIRRRCSGQAIPELSVCLVALLIVLLGYLLISSLVLENVDNVIAARERADRNARRGTPPSGEEQNILSWDYGEKGIAFTGNDKPRLVRIDSSGLNFTQELTDHSGIFSLPAATPNSTGCLPNDYNKTTNLSPLNLFLHAANLTCGKAAENDPLGKRGLGSLKESFKNFFGIRSFLLTDTVFLPARPSIVRPEEIH